MSAVPFDTLKLADYLQAGGFTAEQAHTFASALATAAGADPLATREDLKRDLRALEQDLKRDLRELEQRLTIRLGGMLVVLAGVLLAVFHYLH